MHVTSRYAYIRYRPMASYSYEIKVLHVNLCRQNTVCRLVDARVMHILSAFITIHLYKDSITLWRMQHFGTSDFGTADIRRLRPRTRDVTYEVRTSDEVG
jgi:hypothetical protein